MSRESALSRFLAASPSLRGSLDALRRAAASQAPLLIVGESGSGRTALARALHAESARRRGPLVAVDPAAIPPELFESELFGHAAGAFTGATSAHVGRVEAAAGGTLLLDPVEELPLGVQPKLLRLLAESRYAPLGGRERTADLRFLAVGPDDLAERVRRGAFRADLLFRLDVLRFRLPPLRERRDDLALLAAALLRDLGARLERPGLRLAPESLAWMTAWPWPGNLRELRNVLERAAVLADGDLVAPPPPAQSAERQPRPLATLEREAIVATLAFTRGRQGEAASLLGISRKALWQKRKRFGIP